MRSGADVAVGPHRVFYAALGFALLPGDALDVDPEEHVNAVTRPLGDLRGGHSRVEPGRHGGVAQVVGPAHERGRCLSLAERLAARRVEDLKVGPFGDDPAARPGEYPPVRPGAETFQVVAE